MASRSEVITPRPLRGAAAALSKSSELLIAAMLLAGAQSLFAQGGPPMLTDDPETPGAGAWEINMAYTEQRTSQDHERSFPHVDVN